MPELPEVETLRRELAKALKNKKIKTAKVLWPKTVLWPAKPTSEVGAPLSVAIFEKQLKNKTVGTIERRAKILIFHLIGGHSPRRSIAKSGLAFHLKMTGQLIFHPKAGHKIVGGHPDPKDENNLPNNHTRLILHFTDGSVLYFNDLRKFGWARLVDDAQLKNLTKNIGVEPLSKLFTDQFLIDLFNQYPKRTVKQILLDQTLIAGLGNIYADESAFLSKVLPTRQVATIKPAQIKKLREAIVEILKLSLKMKGTSSRNYRRSTGERGGFVPYLKVYGRAGQPCKVCDTPIEKIKFRGRGTHFCPRCQK